MLRPLGCHLVQGGLVESIKSTALQVYKILETFISMIVRQKQDKQ